MYQSIPKPPIIPPPGNPRALVGNLTQSEARPVGHLAFVSKRLSAVGNKRISQIVWRFFDSGPGFSKCAAFTSHSTWVLRLLSLNFIVISWNMPLFKVWSEDKLNKKFVVAENFAQLVPKGIILFIFIYFMSAWRDRMLHATSDLAD